MASYKYYNLGDQVSERQLAFGTNGLGNHKKYFDNGVGPTTMPMVDTTAGNRLIFLPATQVIIEQTTTGAADNATSGWTSYGATDTQKNALFRGDSSNSSINIPLLNGVKDKNCGIRITITAMKYNIPSGTAETAKYNYWNSSYITSTERYCNLNGMYFWVNGNTDRILTKVYAAKGNASTTWERADGGEDYYLAGWSGGDYVFLRGLQFGGGTSQVTNYWNYRIVFRTDGVDGGDLSTNSPSAQQSIYRICGYGVGGWTLPNNFMKHNHIYEWDFEQNVIFPKSITADFYKIRGGSTGADATRLFYGVCPTPSGTAAKVVNCNGFNSTHLTKGTIMFVTFTYTNSGAVGSLTMSVNGTTAAGIKKQYNGSAPSNLVTAAELQANNTYMFQYNGTNWVCMTLDYNSTYANYTFGNGFAVDSRTSLVTAITATYTSYSLSNGGRVSVIMKYSNNASATLNINTRGAKAIKYYNGSSTLSDIAANVIPANAVAEFIYDGTQYIYVGSYSPGSSGGGVSLNNSGGSTTNYYLMGTPSTIGTVLYRYGTNGPYMNGVDLLAGSDINYKKDITPISGAFVDELFTRDDVTYDFKWKDTDKESSGFIAQWIEDIMPEMVNGEDGEKHVNYNGALSKVVGAMFKKIKSMEDIIQNQQKEINELKNIIKQNGEV